MVAANDVPQAPSPFGDNLAQGGGTGVGHAGAGGGHKNANNLATKGMADSNILETLWK